MKRAGLIASCAVAGLFAAACGGTSAHGSSGSSEAGNHSGTVVVGATWSTLSTPYFKGIESGAIKQAAAAGIKLINLDANNSANTQLDQMQELITQHVKAIVLNPVESVAELSAVRNAKAAGIPVITIDRPMFDAEKAGLVVTHVGASAQEAGYLETQYVCRKYPHAARILGLWGTPGNSVSDERTAGVMQALKTSTCSGAQLVAQHTTANESQEQAYNITSDWLQRFPAGSFNAVVTFADDLSAGVLQALHQAHRTGVLVTGAANFGPFAKAICSGDPEAAATVDFDVVSQGELLVQTVQKILNGQAKTLPTWVHTHSVLVTNKNCKQYPPSA